MAVELEARADGVLDLRRTILTAAWANESLRRTSRLPDLEKWLDPDGVQKKRRRRGADPETSKKTMLAWAKRHGTKAQEADQ